jgi:hypothetical protein
MRGTLLLPIGRRNGAPGRERAALSYARKL